MKSLRNFGQVKSIPFSLKVVAPVLWMKETSSAGGKYTLSCNNITESVTYFGRLAHGFTSLDKENSSVLQSRAQTAEQKLASTRSTGSSSSNQSLTKRKSAEDVRYYYCYCYYTMLSLHYHISAKHFYLGFKYFITPV